MPTPSIRTNRPTLAGAALAAAVVCAAAAGCGRTMIAERADTGYTRGDLGGEMDFWYSLPGRRAVSNDEGLHGLLLLDDPEVAPQSYEERVALAKLKGWLPESWEEPAELAIQRGRIASALAIITGMRGGVMMQLLGPVPRYALREIVYAGLMPSSSEHQPISGDDFIAVVSRTEDYITLKNARGAPPPAAGQ